MTAGQPWFVLVAGVNGAGKSTFAQNADSIRALCGLGGATDEIEIINPDLITKEIVRADPQLLRAEANERAADACEQRVRHLIEGASRSLVIETVLSTDKYKGIVRRAKRKGFRFLFVYVVLASVEEAIQRVAMRVAEGGHDVPTDKVKKRWPRSLKRMPWFWRQADLAYLFFNGASAPDPIRLAEKRDNWVSILQNDLGPTELESLWSRLLRPVSKRRPK
jgi:predicted ABC-type ATPase